MSTAAAGLTAAILLAWLRLLALHGTIDFRAATERVRLGECQSVAVRFLIVLAGWVLPLGWSAGVGQSGEDAFGEPGDVEVEFLYSDGEAPRYFGGGEAEYERGQDTFVASDDRTIRLWDLTDPSHPTPRGQPVTGHHGPALSLAFSPDGRRLATGGADQTIRLWVLDPEWAIRRICDTAGDLTPEQWGRHLPEISTKAMCAAT
jgi:WD domain, G-beta repeat